MSRRVVPVSVLVAYLKSSMEKDPVLKGVLVEGEISNLRKPYSGHWYFSLKDEKSSLSCVMFASSNRRLNFPVNNGDKVVLKGDVSVYTAAGQLQIIVSAMEPSGIGQLYLRLEALKKKLNAEGLFDQAHKKNLPKYPLDVALVTGNNTAAREDVLITLKKRWPIAQIHEYPCPVQGMSAAPEIIQALKKADAENHDVILLVRGGGSLEDLWCFNDEALARVVYDLKTPIVTGIGHEIDTTLCDYVSDVRANTPTGAVEAAVPDISEVIYSLYSLKNSLIQNMNARIAYEKTAFTRYKNAAVFTKPERLYSQQAIHLEYLNERISSAVHVRSFQEKDNLSQILATFSTAIRSKSIRIDNILKNQKSRMAIAINKDLQSERNKIALEKEHLEDAVKNIQNAKDRQLKNTMALLDAYSPLKVMDRGYSVVLKDGEAVHSVVQLKEKDNVLIRLKDGSADAEIVKLEEDNGREKENI